MNGRFLAAIVAVTLGSFVALSPAHAGDEEIATEAVFQRQHLDNIEAPTTLRYSFERSGSLLGDLTDQARLVITAIGTDGRKQVEFHLFSGAAARHIAPQQGFRNNPMIVAFLQRDVEQMSRITGGSPHYFRNRIRDAFTRAATVQAEAVTVDLADRKLEGTKVTVRPFAYDPQLPRFPEFRDKQYEFLLAPEIPGGVYRLRALTPNGTGEPLLDETMTYDGEGSAE